MLLQGACNFVDIGGELITSVKGLSRAVKTLEGTEQIGGQGVQLFETDHVLAPEGMTIATLLARQKASRTATAVLYGAPGTSGFKELHGALMQSTLAGLCGLSRLPIHASPAAPCRVPNSAVQRASCWLPCRCAAMPAFLDIKSPH